MLTWLYNGTGGSILACAVWHGLYNLETGTAAATSMIQAVTSAFVYVLAFLLVGLELRAQTWRSVDPWPPPRGRIAVWASQCDLNQRFGVSAVT